MFDGIYYYTEVWTKWQQAILQTIFSNIFLWNFLISIQI